MVGERLTLWDGLPQESPLSPPQGADIPEILSNLRKIVAHHHLSYYILAIFFLCTV